MKNVCICNVLELIMGSYLLNFPGSDIYFSDSGKWLFPDSGYYNYLNPLIFFHSVDIGKLNLTISLWWYNDYLVIRPLYGLFVSPRMN